MENIKNRIYILTLLSLMLGSIVTAHAQTPEFVKIEGGTFTMGDEWGSGDTHERPTHQVTLSTFYISKTEVTVAQYRAYCQETGVSMPDKPRWGWHDQHPMVKVSWYDVINYADWLGEKLDKLVRLPYEAEWEYAARGGNKSQGNYKYSGGQSLAAVGWYEGNSGNKTHPVGTKTENELGLYDMSGNVWEWCMDRYGKDYYSNSPAQNPKGPRAGSYRILRGGGWGYKAANCRVSTRGRFTPDYSSDFNGFRVVFLED